ncbi:hypothetical protein DM02DRAFT_147536 [Periconia macrospinosa]|uniref:Uncharacterized protein n=1 Tax=Periconia macrospinosa TaxID=97972 RepID=A0A2V1DC45_9PLEO|nr:hypothetical protein DM02DRAFT_147536 [Periconia macrospinosa]
MARPTVSTIAPADQATGSGSGSTTGTAASARKPRQSRTSLFRFPEAETQTQTVSGSQDPSRAIPSVRFAKYDKRPSLLVRDVRGQPRTDPDALTNTEHIDLELGGARLEVLLEERVHCRLTLPENLYWIQLIEEDGTQYIQVGQDELRTDNDFFAPEEFDSLKDVVIGTPEKFLAHVTEFPEDWHINVISLLLTLRNVATAAHHGLLHDDGAQPVSAKDFATQAARISDLEKALKKEKALREKGKDRAANHDDCTDRYQEMRRERDEESARADDLQGRLQAAYQAHDATRLKLAQEEKEATFFKSKYDEEYDRAEQYRNDVNEQEGIVESLRHQLQQQALEHKREVDKLTAKINAYEPSFRRYDSILRNEPRERLERGASARIVSTPPLNSVEEPFVPRRTVRPHEPYIPRSSPAPSPSHLSAHTQGTSSGGSKSKVPDIDKFSGADDEDYDKWKQMAKYKCDTLEFEQERIAYLLKFITGDAWSLVRDIKAVNHSEYFDRLDEFYGHTSADKISDALNQLTDPDAPLKQKPTESFAQWRVRFMAAASLVSLPDDALIKYAFKFMHSTIANATNIKRSNSDNLAQVLKIAQELDRDRQSYSTTKSKPTKPSTKSFPVKETKRVSFADQRSKKTDSMRRTMNARTDQERKILKELKLCFRCGSDQHQMRDSDAPCKDKPPVPGYKIPALSARLAAVDIDYDDNYRFDSDEGQEADAASEEDSETDEEEDF